MGSDEECSQITAFFSGCNVLVTGATGFMGKVLVEKLLRSCTDIRAIYLLMRPKNGSNLEDRLREFKANVIFDRLREEGPVGMLDKLTAVNGDVTQIGLGLSKPDTCKLCSEVNVVFHCAATVRFDDTDRQTILLNTRGTQELTSLALQMQHLKVLVLVSTAYSNADRSFIDEVVYPAHEDYNYVIKCAEKLEDLELSRLTTEMMKGLPNTYVFSKSLGENIVYDQKGKLPAAIFRPSLVCPAYEEPMPGWVDSKNGPMGVLIGASTGLLRTMRGDGNKKTDLIPVDFAINAMIAVAWHIAATKRLDIPVYNCTTSSQVDVTWNGFLDLGIQEYDKWPLLQVFWYPGGAIHCSKLMHLMCFFIKQLIPAMLLDLVLLFSWKKPMFFKLQTGIYSKLNTIEYFVSNEWTFKNSNFRSLLKHMAPEDRRIFNFDATKIDWKEYISRWVLGARRFIVKLDDSNIPEARTKLRRLFWLNQVMQYAFYGCVTWILTPYFLQSISGIRSMFAVANIQT